jgi:hypothetical protein
MEPWDTIARIIFLAAGLMACRVIFTALKEAFR